MDSIFADIKYFLEHEPSKRYNMLDPSYLEEFNHLPIEITNYEPKYRKIHEYIKGFVNIVYSQKQNEYVTLIGTIGKTHNINNQWFIMTSDGTLAMYEIYQTLDELYKHLEMDVEENLLIAAAKWTQPIIRIQSCFRGWQARMKYRFNPATRLCKHLLLTEFRNMI